MTKWVLEEAHPASLRCVEGGLFVVRLKDGRAEWVAATQDVRDGDWAQVPGHSPLMPALDAATMPDAGPVPYRMPQLPVYCFSKTRVVIRGLPVASVPFTVTVMVFPSFEITV